MSKCPYLKERPFYFVRFVYVSQAQRWNISTAQCIFAELSISPPIHRIWLSPSPKQLLHCPGGESQADNPLHSEWHSCSLSRVLSLLLTSKLGQGQSEPDIVSSLSPGWSFQPTPGTEWRKITPDLCHMCLKWSSCDVKLQEINNADSLPLSRRSYSPVLVGGESRSSVFKSRPLHANHIDQQRGGCGMV